MSTEFKAVTPQRAVEIMKAWAYHPWPMSVQDGIDVYTNLGFKGDPQDPELFTSDMSPAKPDSYLVSTDGIIDESVLCLSAWLPEEYSESSRPRARAYYESFVRAFHEVLGGTRDSEEGEDYSSTLWVANERVSVSLEGMPTLILLTVESPQQTEYTLDELEAEENGEETGADYF